MHDCRYHSAGLSLPLAASTLLALEYGNHTNICASSECEPIRIYVPAVNLDIIHICAECGVTTITVGLVVRMCRKFHKLRTVAELLLVTVV